MHEGIPILNYLVPKAVHPRERAAHRRGVREGAARSTTNGPPQPRADRRARRAHGVRRRAGRRRPGERVSLDRARHRHRVRQVGHAEGRHGHACSRRCPTCSSAAMPRSVRRTSSGRWRTATTRRFPSTSCATARTCASVRAPMVEPAVAEDGHTRVELRQRRLHRPALQGADQGQQGSRSRTSRSRSRLGFDPQARLCRSRSAASTATCRRCSRPSCASSAMPASTSARWTASPSPTTAKSRSCAPA